MCDGARAAGVHLIQGPDETGSARHPCLLIPSDSHEKEDLNQEHHVALFYKVESFNFTRHHFSAKAAGSS